MSNPVRFRRFAWGFLAYLMVVILFGAWVRISGSGDGCGSHWPTCHGAVIPPAPETKTVIEFTHRLTSGLCGILGLVLVGWARRVSRPVFLASLATMFFLLVEAFVGAVLVKRQLVAGDASVSRAVVIALHLTNTMLLTASAATAAWWASAGKGLRRPAAARGWLAAGVAALVLTNMSGAITALGDTLFPIQPAFGGDLLAKVRSDLSASHHFLVRLRILHPVIAAAAAAVWLGIFRRFWRGEARPLYGWGASLVAVEVALGVWNVWLAAPGWMQILHLLAAQAVWIAAWLATLDVWPAAAPAAAPWPGDAASRQPAA